MISQKMTEVWIPDWPRVRPDVLDALKNGRAMLREGVAYWTGVDGQRGIAQHVPLIKTQLAEGANLLQMAGAAAVPVAAATGVILAAIVIQTRYISNKLDHIQKTIDNVAKDVRAQHILFYADKVSEYFGAVDAARTILSFRDIADETFDVASSLIGPLAVHRHQLLSFADNIGLLLNQPSISDEHFELILDFLHHTLDLVPKGICIESALAVRAGKFGLADRIIEAGRDRYSIALHGYRAVLNESFQEIVKGRAGTGRSAVIRRMETSARALLESGENRLLLTVGAEGSLRFLGESNEELAAPKVG